MHACIFYYKSCLTSNLNRIPTDTQIIGIYKSIYVFIQKDKLVKQDMR